MYKNNLLFSILALSVSVQVSCQSYKNKTSKTETTDHFPEEIIFNAPSQNPEGIEYNPITNTFFLSAINKTTPILSVKTDGAVESFSNDKETVSKASFGLQVDAKNNRLIACMNGDNLGTINIYNLKSGELEHTVQLSSLLPEAKTYQINDVVVDNENNIYVTGRLEDAIYKIDSDLNATVFFQKEGLTKPNGIIYHPNGYLIVSYSHQNSSLVKIPINNPEAAESITINDYDFKGFDGMLLNEKGNVIGVSFSSDANGDNYVIELESKDEWKSSQVVNSKKTKKSTTIAQVTPNLYYVLNQDWKNRNAENWTLEKVAF